MAAELKRATSDWLENGHFFVSGAATCSAPCLRHLETAEGEPEVGPVTPMTGSVFLINYKEHLNEVVERFFWTALKTQSYAV